MEAHVGYYIIGKKRYEHSGVPERECAENKNHQFDGSMNFCAECGTKLITVIKDDSRELNIYDIPEEEGCVEDQFLFPEYTPAKEGEVIGISNYRNCGHFNITDAKLFDLENMEAIKARQYGDFIEMHMNDIDLLRKYVYDDLEIKYGLFLYSY